MLQIRLLQSWVIYDSEVKQGVPVIVAIKIQGFGKLAFP